MNDQPNEKVQRWARTWDGMGHDDNGLFVTLHAYESLRAQYEAEKARADGRGGRGCGFVSYANYAARLLELAAANTRAEAAEQRVREVEARADASWQAWPDARRAFCKLMSDLTLRFKSGNSVPVERTHLTADEFAVIENHALASEDIAWKQYDAHSEARADAARWQHARGLTEFRDFQETPEQLDARIDRAIAKDAAEQESWNG